MKKRGIILLALFLGVIAFVGYQKLKPRPCIVCDQPYVLCTSAQCIPSPSNPSELICFCETKNGKSLGHTSCKKRQPFTDRFGLKHLISTFSFEDFPCKKTMTCPANTPWGNCLDQKCIVDPLHPEKAICTCRLVEGESFQTLGGSCDTGTCQTGFWSGATVEGNKENVEFLMKALELEKSPAKSFLHEK